MLKALRRLLAPRTTNSPVEPGPASGDPRLRAAHAALLEGAQCAKSGDAIAAVRALARAYAGFSGARDRRRAALVQQLLVLLIDGLQDTDLAQAAHRIAGEELRRSGHYADDARLGLVRARALAARGAWALAQALLDDAAALFRRIGHVSGQIECLIARADVAVRSGHLPDARAALSEARVLAETEARPQHRPALLAGITAAEDSLA